MDASKLGEEQRTRPSWPVTDKTDKIEPVEPHDRPLAYGMAFSGPLVSDELAALLLSAPGGRWPEVRLEWRHEADQLRDESLEDDAAVLRCLFGGYLETDRATASATFASPSPPDAHVLAHPGLTGVAAVFARWLGRSAFHGGAVLTTHGTWGLVGSKGRGKSTTLAQLALSGHQVLADDLVTLEGTEALTGPRTLDLRPSAARRLDGAFRSVRVRGGERQRLVLGPTVASAPLRGWICLGLGRRVEVERVAPSERLGVLAEHLAVRAVPRDPVRYLELASLPVWHVRRPLSWDSLATAASAIEDVIGGA